MLCFSWMGTYCRHILACLHFNENINRQSKTTKNGKTYFKVIYPKYKLGEELVREVASSPTYEYVKNLKNLLLTLPVLQMRELYEAHKSKAPGSLTSQFTERLSREEAIQRQEKRRRLTVELFPSVADQEILHSTEIDNTIATNPKQRKKPKCKKCGNLMKGHSTSECERITSQQPT